MKRRTLKTLAVLSAFGLVMSASHSQAQGKLSVLKRGGTASSHASHGASHFAQSPNPGTTSHTTFSYIDFPQSPYTFAAGINRGAANPKVLAVGEYGPELAGGFGLQVEGKKGTAYVFDPIVYPGSTLQAAFGVNDSEEIVGIYTTTSATYGYLYSKGKFTSLTVPFSGAVVTEAFDIDVPPFAVPISV
jgi:hypothetical protein